MGRRVLRQEAEAVQTLADQLGDSFSEAVEWVLGCTGRVLTCGIGKSGHIARKTAGTLSSTGTPSGFLQAAEAVHGDLGMVTGGDVVILYSHSGETDELVRLFPPLRSIGARTILVTGRPKSSAGRLADLVLETHVGEEACPNNLAPTTSTTVMLALSDALALAVMERRGFSPDDFARFHPSGALGKRLTLTVADVMRPAAEIGRVGPGDSILEVIRTMTEAHVGAACVVEEGLLRGIVSESDLRRHLLKDPGRMDVPAAQIMNSNAATITPDLLAMEALEAFQNYPVKIGEMPVVLEDRLIGLLVLKDLLRSGIV
ncbi:KpsF/GutQ family protein [Fimbriimonas ginsengisoli Gsoil 348]|uniref:KpsF/GutQ family protein n=1 Tax=Fimbriimonas ginsengisoli Gsoil 348 TaxID=661478 RepID=A0A068NQZ3_FIMGI|nr:KpsF/GutQ family protein [Fimbriimonas ginsengisoli Gsoil 348]